MRQFLILVALICGFGLTAAFAQATPPVPAPAPVRDAEGHIVVSDEVPTVEINETNQAAEGESDWSEAGDAEYSVVDNPAAMAAEEAARAAPSQSFGTAPQPVTLSAKLIDEGPIIPSGLSWRIFSADATSSGDIQLVTRSDQSVAVLSLPPGDYLIQASYGLAQATDTLTIRDAPQARILVLDAGALRLNARVTGGLTIPAHLLRFDIYPQGLEDDPRSIIAADVQPDEPIHLNAGIYHVISHYGSVNAVAETDIRVDQGQLTDATMFHDAAQVSFRLVSEIGGEAIADVDWTIKNDAGATVFQFTGTFPSAILAGGDYVVLAKRGDAVYNREFSVVPGPAQEIEVLTSL